MGYEALNASNEEIVENNLFSVTKVPALVSESLYGGLSAAQSARFIEEKLCPISGIGWHWPSSSLDLSPFSEESGGG